MKSRSEASVQGVYSTLTLLAFGLIFGACSPSENSQIGSESESILSSGKRITIALIPKKKGLPYFTSCASGAEEAARELGNVDLIYDGPTDGSPEKQASMIEQYALKGVNVIAVSPNDPEVVAPAMRKAREKGIHVITWDADAVTDARSYFVNQSTAQAIAYGMVDTMVQDLGGPEVKAQVAIVTAYLTAANQNIWIEHMKARMADTYPNLDLVAIKPSDEDQKLAFKVTQDLMKAYPDIKGFFGISSVSFPGAAEAVKQAGRSGEVMVTGLATPNSMKAYVQDGTVKSVVLWNTAELGYLTVQVGAALANGTLNPGDEQFVAGKLGEKEVAGDQVLLGDILVFNQENIDQYDF